MSIGSRIKQRREELGITQIELAAMIGVTKGAIGNYETDSNSPKASIMYRIFNALKCDANFLYQDDIKENDLCISKNECTLMEMFNQMNDEGQAKLLDYADDLVRSGKYIKTDKTSMVYEK